MSLEKNAMAFPRERVILHLTHKMKRWNALVVRRNVRFQVHGQANVSPPAVGREGCE